MWKISMRYCSRKLSTKMYSCKVQKFSRCIWRNCSAWNLCVVNCIVLLMNVLFYAANNYFLFATFESYFLSPLDSETKALLEKTFRVFVETMDSANITFFIFSGSLLGSFRHHGPIPWDDDVDVLINATDQNRVVEALTTRDPQSFGLHIVRSDGVDYVYQWKFYPKSGHSLFYKAYRTPYIDIFFFYENRTHIWNGSPFFRDSEMWRKSIVFPLQRRQFGKLLVPAPCNTEAFLAMNFDLSVCQSRHFSHSFDMHFLSRPVKVPCEQLYHLYPFVHRTRRFSANVSLVHEGLVYRGVTIGEMTTRPC